MPESYTKYSTAAVGVTGRRQMLTLSGGAMAAVGLTAGATAVATDVGRNPVSLDAELLALRSQFDVILAEYNATEVTSGASRGESEKDHDAWVARIGQKFADMDMPPPQTAEGRALKAAAAMYHLRFAYRGAGWPGDGEELAWKVLSELAGNTYVPPARPAWLSADTSPPRRAA